MCTRFPAIFECSFEWELRTLNLGEGEAVGVGMVFFERALVRPFIVTFPLSLRVSDILPFLFSITPFFPTHLYSPPNFPMVDRLLATKSEVVRLIVRAISLISNPPTSQTDGQTDRQTNVRHAIARPRPALKCIPR